jgi:hypothetical protein
MRFAVFVLAVGIFLGAMMIDAERRVVRGQIIALQRGLAECDACNPKTPGEFR